MKLIKLRCGVGRYDDVSPFILVDGKLELKIELPQLKGDYYLITDNGKQNKILLPVDGKVTLENLTEGELNMSVKHYFKGELIREYKIEPLVLKNIDGNISADPEIIELKKELSELKKEFVQYKQSIEQHEKLINAKLLALLKFAIKDYSENAFLGYGTLDEFISEFHVELTDEEIK